MKENFRRDRAGLYHYVPHDSLTLGESAEEAIEIRPKARPAWFWFNNSPAPIYPEDSVQNLLDRWSQWRLAYQSHDDKFLGCLLALATP